MERRATADAPPPAMPTTPEDVVRAFWRLMASNDFESVRSIARRRLRPRKWPQSAERIRGGANFAHERRVAGARAWQFRIERLVGQGASVVTEVAITDGV